MNVRNILEKRKYLLPLLKFTYLTNSIPRESKSPKSPKSQFYKKKKKRMLETFLEKENIYSKP